MTAISEEMLLAYADGELDEVSRRRVEASLARDQALAARLAAHRSLTAKLVESYAPLAEAPVPDRFAALLTQPQKIASKPFARRPFAWSGLAIAASLAFGVFVGQELGNKAAPLSVQRGQLVAQGALKEALDTQLASNQPTDAATRIGLTFRAKDGRWCRSFDGRDVAGVACRAGTDWRLEQVLPGRVSQAEFRQASSEDERISATVEALMADQPADARAEKMGLDDDWK
ncbi:MAG: anti-sigma factor [Sphingobium sp.]|uniref:anti-sigma factor family protein n=1 Tax=Sphingobium sp. TaxID=1912891 RepID=UPI0029A35046|nr:anti-sigma factor [Sphingobium sp.]MDX3910410.1 anti-sigma factor [Sphingobium sp.]